MDIHIKSALLKFDVQYKFNVSEGASVVNLELFGDACEELKKVPVLIWNI